MTTETERTERRAKLSRTILEHIGAAEGDSISLQSLFISSEDDTEILKGTLKSNNKQVTVGEFYVVINWKSLMLYISFIVWFPVYSSIHRKIQAIPMYYRSFLGLENTGTR